MTTGVSQAAWLVAASVDKEVHITDGSSESVGENAVAISVNDLDVGSICVCQARRATAPLTSGWVQA